MITELLIDFLSQHIRDVSKRFSLVRAACFGKKRRSLFTLGFKGFTLVELAVVLVILGAIFMSVLKVESMVRGAKIRQLLNQYRELRTAILVYKDKYGYLPGDDPYAREHVGATHAAAVSLGGGNGRIETANYENSFLFEHLGKTGLIKGTYNGNRLGSQPLFSETPMNHPFTAALPQVPSYVLVLYDSGVKNNIIEFANLPYDAAQALDTAFDDGVWNTGNVQSGRDYTAIATKDEMTGVYGVYPSGSVRYTYIIFN